MSEGTKGRAWESNRANFDRNLAVVIGIDRYENDSIRNLSTAVSDAGAIADLLEQAYAYKQSDEKPEVIRLFDKEATLEALQHLFHTRIPDELNPGEGDRLIIYYAGHGLPRSNDDGPEGYLVPHDADPTKPELFLAMRDVSAALSKLECHHLLVILDCCFAGTFRWAGSRKAVPILETIRREHYYHFIRHPAWQVITSSAHDQEALDVARLKEDNRKPVPGLDTPHSPFALAILEGLQTGDDSQRANADLYPDGVVTAHELFVYLQNRVKELSGERQNPGIFPLRQDYDKGEFIFTRPEFDPQKLAEALPLNEDNNPYRGLNSFDEKHAAFFFGRQAPIDELAGRLSKPDQALTVVLGVSGSGKSSLVKAGLLPHLRNPKSEKQAEQQPQQWYILNPMRPGELPFISLGRTLLPVVKAELLEQVAQVSFLDEFFKPMLKAKTEAKQNSVSVPQDQQVQADETLMKVADSWCSATPEAKLLLIEDYFAQLEKLGNLQEQEQLKELYDRILAELDAVSKHLQQEPQYFSRLIATWSQKHPGVRLLLVIDQFEELLTRSQDDRESSKQTEQQDGVHGVSLKENCPTEQKEWQKFLEVLRIAIADHPQFLRLVLTLRSDFEPRFLTSALEPYWKDARFPVRAMISDELRQVIENPALKQALYFEELKDEKGNTIGNLVSKLVDEVGQMPGALPLLSFTLSELYISLYKRWQDDPKYTGRTLLFADYEALGGVAGALIRRATEEYEALDEMHQATMRRVMLRMVAIEGGGVARRRVPNSELVYSDDRENERVEQVIKQLVEARLLVTGQETGEPHVEPAHDFLVRGWDELQRWVKEEQSNILLQQRLTPQANDWHEIAEKTEIAEGDEKAIGLLWNNHPRLSELRELLRLNKNYWLNQKETVFINKSFSKRQAVEEDLREQLKREKELRIRAELREKTARVENLISVNPFTALEGALEAIDQNIQEKPDEVLAPLSRKLHQLTQVIPPSPITLYGHENPLSAAFSPTEELIISGDLEGTLRFWDLQGSPVGLPIRTNYGIEFVAFSPNGQLVIAGNSRSLRFWTLQGKPASYPFSAPVENPITVAFSSDEKVIAIGEKEGKLQLRDIQGKPIGLPFYGHEGRITSVAFSPDGLLIVSGSEDGFLRLWSLRGQLLGEPFFVHTKAVTCITFSSNGQLIASGSADGTLCLWKLKENLVEKLLEHEYGIHFVVFSPDDQLIASSASHLQSRWGAGNALIASGDGSTIHLQNLRGEYVSLPLKEFSGNILSLYFKDDRLLVANEDDGKLKLWNLHIGEKQQPLIESKDLIKTIDFNLSEELVLSEDVNNVVSLWNLQGELEKQFYKENR